jgi:hypothetical protein
MTEPSPAIPLPPVDGTEQDAFDYNRRSLLAILGPLGAAKIQLTFSGSGDSGDLDETRVLDKDDRPLDLDLERIHMLAAHANSWWQGGRNQSRVDTRYQNAAAAANSMAWSAISEQAPGGWEINEGGNGGGTIDLETGHIDVWFEHNPPDEYDEEYDEDITTEDDPDADAGDNAPGSPSP